MKKLLVFPALFSLALIFACGEINEETDSADDSTAEQMDDEEDATPIQKYFETHDTMYIAEDAVFVHMHNGEETRGRTAIAQMLDHIYHVAFDARAEVVNTIITEDKALLEANFIGTHTGDFAGIAATGKNVNVPLAVSYDIEDGLITKARVYLLAGSMMQQLGAEGQEKEME